MCVMFIAHFVCVKKKMQKHFTNNRQTTTDTQNSYHHKCITITGENKTENKWKFIRNEISRNLICMMRERKLYKRFYEPISVDTTNQTFALINMVTVIAMCAVHCTLYAAVRYSNVSYEFWAVCRTFLMMINDDLLPFALTKQHFVFDLSRNGLF